MRDITKESSGLGSLGVEEAVPTELVERAPGQVTAQKEVHLKGDPSLSHATHIGAPQGDAQDRVRSFG